MLRIVRAVLAVAAVRWRESPRRVGANVVGEGLVTPVDVRANALLPVVEVLALLLVRVVRPEVVRAGAVLDLVVAAPRMQLELPAIARHGRDLFPAQVLGVASVDPADVDEHDCVEVELLEDPVRASPRVGPRVVEGHEQRPRGKYDTPSLDETEVRLEVNRAVTGLRDQRHLLREVLEADPVRCVVLVREPAFGADPVIEEHGDSRAIRRQWRPHLLLLGSEHDLRSRCRCPGRRCLVRAAACSQSHCAAGNGKECRHHPHRRRL